MSAPQRIVGVIGGMGPEATVELMRRVIALTPARDDQDHVHLIVDNNPHIPSRIAHLIDRTGEDPTPELQRMARGLEAAGAQVLAMPCNTAHCYAPAIRAAVQVPLLHMVDLTVERIAARRPHARVGLLASTAVIQARLYERAFEAVGCTLRAPAAQAEIMRLITGVKRGASGDAPRRAFADIAAALSAESDVLLIACTELSILAAAVRVSVPVVDSLDVLSESIVVFARGDGAGDPFPRG